jgi:hypothetical protein
LDVEAARVSFALYHFQGPAIVLLAPVGQLLTTVGSIRPDLLEPWHERSQLSYRHVSHRLCLKGLRQDEAQSQPLTGRRGAAYPTKLPSSPL